MKKIAPITDKLREMAYATRTYQNWLSRGDAEALMLVPTDIWPGQANLGQMCLSDDFGLGVDGAEAEPALLFELRRPATAIDAANDLRLHEGAWLRDLRALGGDEARRRARQLMGAWLDRFANWDVVSWSLPTLGARIANWLALHDFYLASADDNFRARVFAALSAQTRHLSLALPAQLNGYQFLKAVKGLIYGGLCLPEMEGQAAKGLDLLGSRLDTLLTPDGLMRERAPLIHMLALRDLVDIRNLLRQAGIAAPALLDRIIDQMAPALRCMRYGDGNLALFHGGDEGQSVVIEALLQQTGTRSRSRASLADSGYERVACSRALLLLDAGAPPPPGYDDIAHAGLGAFEFSIGRERLIVNCGSLARLHQPGKGSQSGGVQAWRQALAASAAHTTLVLGDTNAVEVLPHGLGQIGNGQRHGGLLPLHVESVRDETQDENGTPLTRVSVTHDAYAQRYGVMCQRTLALQQDGQALYGEDQLRGAVGTGYAVRFHLHPSVQVSLIQEGRAALLKLPSGQGWRFRSLSGAPVLLTASIYAGDGITHRPTRQLILEGKMASDLTRIGWSLVREG